jgi:hypothetical protein
VARPNRSSTLPEKALSPCSRHKRGMRHCEALDAFDPEIGRRRPPSSCIQAYPCPVPSSHRSISSRPNCGLCRLPGNDRTSTRRSTSASSSKDANASAARVPCPTVRSVVTSAFCADHLSWGQRTVKEASPRGQPILKPTGRHATFAASAPAVGSWPSLIHPYFVGQGVGMSPLVRPLTARKVQVEVDIGLLVSIG